MGMGPTVTVGYVDDDGNWKPVTASAGLPVSGAGGGTELESYEQVSSLPDYPTEFPPSGHTHAAGDVTSGTFAAARIPNLAISKVTGLQGELDGKQAAGSYAAATHTHEIVDVNGLQAIINDLTSRVDALENPEPA